MFCQNCKTPLKPDTSLEDLNPAAFNLLVDATGKTPEPSSSKSPSRPLYTNEQKALYDRASATTPSPAVRRAHLPEHRDDPNHPSSPSSANTNNNNPAMSFIMLTESQVVAPAKESTHDYASPSRRKSTRNSSITSHSSDDDENLLSRKMSTNNKFFSILSSRSDIDHPICTECTDLLISSLERRLANANRERDAYALFLKNAIADVPTEEEQAQAEAELKSIREQEATVLSELQALEQEKLALDLELSALDLESRALDEEEAAFWAERNAFAATLAEFQAERDSVNLRYDHDARQLERLQRTNVYNDTFCISHNGFFGTINNLRLGRLAGHGVEWAEINAAWGFACLLVATVAEKLGFAFQGYRLNPMGSTSSVDKIVESSPSASTRVSASQHSANTAKATTTTLPLYYSSELPLGIGFLHRNFDAAMVAFLECIRQLGEHVERTTRGKTPGSTDGLRLPYGIKQDRIHDVSIKLGTFGGGAGDEAWTKACKLTLTCCKFLLAHTSNVRGGSGGKSADAR